MAEALVTAKRSGMPPERVNLLEQAVELVAADQTDWWHITTPLDIELGGELIDVDGVESLRLVSRYKTGVVPRYKSGEHESGVSVSTRAEPNLDIIASFDDYHTSPVFDRGLAWVQVTPPPPNLAHLLTHIKPEHGLGRDELLLRTLNVGRMATILIMRLLESDPNPPYSH